MPVSWSAHTVNFAVWSMRGSVSASPTGTEKKRYASGNASAQATRPPSTTQTASGAIATNANWRAACTPTSSETSHAKAAAATSASAPHAGRGTIRASPARRVHAM